MSFFNLFKKKKKKLTDIDLSWFKESLKNDDTDLDEDLQKIADELGISKEELDLDELIEIIDLRKDISDEDLALVHKTVNETINQHLQEKSDKKTVSGDDEVDVENYLYYFFPIHHDRVVNQPGLERIVLESTNIIMKSDNLDIIISRYQLIKDHLMGKNWTTNEYPNPPLDQSGFEEFYEELDSATEQRILMICTTIFSKKLEQAKSMKTAKGRARNIIKLIKYYEDNINKIPKNLKNVLENITIIEDLKNIKQQDSEETKLILDTGIELPNWWN